MSPVHRFSEARVGAQELTVYRVGMVPPRAGDIIDRDGGKARITRLTVRPADRPIDETLGARPDLGDFMVNLEYEYVEDEVPLDA